MQRTCRQCRQNFEISESDLAFYEKVSPIFSGKKELIPPPTLCPDCRVQRRLAWRNDRTFYQRTCDLTGKPMISIYPAGTPFPVYQSTAWYGDGWDPMDYGRPFDPTRPFLDQWQELALAVPKMGMDLVNCENSDYCNYCGDDKNCYLDIAGEANEDCYFDLFTKYSRNCVDCTFVYRSTLCYECIQCYDCYGLKHCQYMDNCSDCAFCFDCKGCKSCALCINLRSKEYCILNEQYSKEEYTRKLAELRLSSSSATREVAAIWKRHRIERGIYRDMYTVNCEDCTGNDIKNSKNCHHCFNALDCEDCRYLYDVLNAKDCQDLNYSLYQPEVAYETCSTLNMRFAAFNYASHYCANMYYCMMIDNSHDLLGCIGLDRKQYCILNKQYSKQEYEALVPAIIDNMRASGQWGEFYPAALSPFAYNETVAHEYMPLTKAEVERRGWRWADEKSAGAPASSGSPPDAIGNADDAVCNQVFTCEASGKQYRIIPQELKFYRQMAIPLPSRSPAQRHLDRNALRNPRKLWNRKCAQCQQAIQTTYAPDRPEKVYCESCYLKLVY